MSVTKGKNDSNIFIPFSDNFYIDKSIKKSNKFYIKSYKNKNIAELSLSLQGDRWVVIVSSVFKKVSSIYQLSKILNQFLEKFNLDFGGVKDENNLILSLFPLYNFLPEDNENHYDVGSKKILFYKNFSGYIRFCPEEDLPEKEDVERLIANLSRFDLGEKTLIEFAKRNKKKNLSFESDPIDYESEYANFYFSADYIEQMKELGKSRLYINSKDKKVLIDLSFYKENEEFVNLPFLNNEDILRNNAFIVPKIIKINNNNKEKISLHFFVSSSTPISYLDLSDQSIADNVRKIDLNISPLWNRDIYSKMSFFYHSIKTLKNKDCLIVRMAENDIALLLSFYGNKKSHLFSLLDNESIKAKDYITLYENFFKRK